MNSLDGQVTAYLGRGLRAVSAVSSALVTASGSSSPASFLYGPYRRGMNFCS